MTVAAISMFKDEIDVAELVVRHLADEALDLIIVADNNSSDGTAEKLRSLRLHTKLIVVDDPEPGFYQSSKMTALARQAADLGATWIVPFDADELWFQSGERIGLWLAALPDDVGVVRAELTNHFCSALDPVDDNPFTRIQFRQREPGALPKVAFRWTDNAVIAQGNHGVSGVTGRTIDGFEIRHFPFRSLEHFILKAKNGAAAYAATDLHESEGAHWRQYGALLDRYGEEALREVYERWFWNLSPVDAGMVWDPAPYMRWRSR